MKYEYYHGFIKQLIKMFINVKWNFTFFLIKNILNINIKILLFINILVHINKTLKTFKENAPFCPFRVDNMICTVFHF